MKRKFLEDLGLEKEAIDKIMAEHGTDIEKAKGESENVKKERDSFEEQLNAANETIKKFEDYDQVKGQVKEYQETINKMKQDQETAAAKTAIQSQLETYANEKGAKDIDVIKTLADMDSLLASKTQDTDIKTFVDNLAENKAYLFGAGEPIDNPIVGATGSNGEILKTSGINFQFTGVRPRPKQE